MPGRIANIVAQGMLETQQIVRKGLPDGALIDSIAKKIDSVIDNAIRDGKITVTVNLEPSDDMPKWLKAVLEKSDGITIDIALPSI